MKKLIYTLALAGVFSVGASAQPSGSYYAHARSSSMDAFRHLGLGIEVGTTGVGVDLSLPVVSQHLVVKTGVNFNPGIKPKMDFDFETETIDRELSRVNGVIDMYNDYLTRVPGASGLLNPMERLDATPFDGVGVSVEPNLNLTNYKILLEYYPSTYSSFHLVAGLYFGKTNLIDLKGTMDAADWQNYQKIYGQLPGLSQTAVEYVDRYNSIARPYGLPTIDGVTPVRNDDLTLTYAYDGKTYMIDPEAGEGAVKASIEVKAVKPYLGIGFGRPVPQKRVGFQFELGVWFHGTPKLVIDETVNPQTTISAQADVSDDINDIMDKAKKVTVYPQIAFRLTGRLF